MQTSSPWIAVIMEVNLILIPSETNLGISQTIAIREEELFSFSSSLDDGICTWFFLLPIRALTIYISATEDFFGTILVIY